MSSTGCAAAVGVPEAGLGASSRRPRFSAPRSLWVPVPPGMLSRALLLHEVASVSPSVNEGAVPEGP